MLTKKYNILKILFTGLFSFLLATSAMAHSPLKNTTPTDESTVLELPENLLLNFKDSMRMTRMTLTNPDQDIIEINLIKYKTFISDYSIPMKNMGKGIYVVKWRGLGSDWHAMNGSFSFLVK